MYVIENHTPYSPIAWLRPKLYTHATTSTTQILSCDRSKLRQAATPAKSHHSWLKSPVELIHFIYTRVDHCRAGVMHGATLQELFKPRPLRDHHTVFDCMLRKPGKTTLSSKSIPSRCVAWLKSMLIVLVRSRRSWTAIERTGAPIMVATSICTMTNISYEQINTHKTPCSLVAIRGAPTRSTVSNVKTSYIFFDKFGNNAWLRREPIDYIVCDALELQLIYYRHTGVACYRLHRWKQRASSFALSDTHHVFNCFE